MSRSKVSGNYASGISLPFRADSDGGIALTEGDAYIKGQVLATVFPNHSENPFQDIGGTEEPVFENPDSIEWRVAVKRRIQRQFKTLQKENLARLLDVRFGLVQGTGEYEIGVTYINMESTTKSEVTASVSATGTLGVRVQSAGGGRI